MSLGTFDPATAYDHTYLYEPGAVAAGYTNREADGNEPAPSNGCNVLRVDIGTRDWMNIAEAMGLQARRTIWKLWPEEEDAPAPAVDDKLTVGGVEWIIDDVIERHFGARYIVATVEASEQ